MVFRRPGRAGFGLEVECFRVEAGEQVFLHGPSGSGKSTLLSLVGGVLDARSGIVRILGTELCG
nr:ATP-binding cassette domain-containing protein [Zoogloeaceae bacterium]